MYVTEAMIQSMEEMMRNASRHGKSPAQDDDGTQRRMHGTKLDRRPRRDMWAQLSDAMANALFKQSSSMTEWTDPKRSHTHDDGMEHLHPVVMYPHTHDDPFQRQVVW